MGGCVGAWEGGIEGWDGLERGEGEGKREEGGRIRVEVEGTEGLEG